jgi:hypothetical protein
MNGSQIVLICSGVMPMPLSFTSNSIVALSAVVLVITASIFTMPELVNFTAFESKFTNTWRSLVGSPQIFLPTDGSA